MSARNPGFGWDLPPGCTDADIDRAFGDVPMKPCPACGGDGAVQNPEVTEFISLEKCGNCDGTGEVEMTEDDFLERKLEAAERAYDEWKDRQSEKAAESNVQRNVQRNDTR